MSLSKQIAETKAKASTLLAMDPSRLDAASRANLAAQLLDLRVSVAESFTGEKRVQEVTDLLAKIDEAKKIAEDTDSGDVGGFRSGVIGDTPVGPAGLDGFNAANKYISTLTGEARDNAIKAFNEAAAAIAANLSAGKPALPSAVESKELDAKAKELLEAARDELLVHEERGEAAEDLVDALVERVRAAKSETAEVSSKVTEAEAKISALEKQVNEAKVANEALVKTISEMTAKPTGEKVNESVTTSGAPTGTPVTESKKTLAERIASATGKTTESVLPAPGGKAASDKDASEAAPIVESTGPCRAALAAAAAIKALAKSGDIRI